MKRRNHEVPRGLLKNWLSRDRGREGLLHIDLSSGRLHFDEGSKANFAITDYIYVPERKNGERDDTLEDWFAVDESGLAVFAQHAANGTLSSFTNQKLLNQAIRGCIGLGYRSAYNMFLSVQSLSPRSRSLHEAGVQNVLRAIGKKFRQFANWDFMVLYDLPVTLLVNERPFLDFTLRGYDMVIMALGPRSLLLGTPRNQPASSGMTISVGQARADHVRIAGLYNHSVVEMARQWVVASSRADLEVVQAELTPQKVSDRSRSDRTIAIAHSAS